MDTLQVYSVRTNGQLPQGPYWEVGCTWHCSLFLFDMFSYVRVLFFQYMEESEDCPSNSSCQRENKM